MKKVITLALGFIVLSMQAQLPTYVPSNGLVAYYPFSGNANDISGNSNNGTVNGALLTTDRFGKENSAYNFDGINDLISINQQSNLNLANLNSVTYSGWFLPNNYNNMFLLRHGSTTPNLGTSNEITFSHLDNKKVMYSNWNQSKTGYVIIYTEPVTLDWHHFALVIDYATNNAKLYIDNKLFESSNVQLFKPTNSVLHFGYNSSINQAYLNGKLDDVGIWNRALTENEITALYQSKEYKLPSYLPNNGLVAFYPFNGNANDMSGYGNNGSVNGATPIADRFGNENAAYKLDGINDYILVSNKSQLNFNKGTISFWLKTSSNALMQPLKKCNYNDASGEQFAFGINNSNNLFAVKQKSNCVAGQGWLIVNSASPINNNQWHHIVGIIDSNVIKFYADGILISQSALSQVGSDVCTGDLNIGRNWANDGLWYNGLIDDVAIWNRALTENEIKGLYDANICYANITVTDTLVINIGLLSVNPVTYKNTITIAPNPAKDHITIDCGNLETVTGYQIKIMNSLGQQVFTTPMNQQKFTIPLNTWGGTGLYFVHIVDAQGHTIDVKKIILE